MTLIPFPSLCLPSEAATLVMLSVARQPLRMKKVKAKVGIMEDETILLSIKVASLKSKFEV